MRIVSAHTAVALSILLLPLAPLARSFHADTFAQQFSKDEGPLPESLEALINSKQKLIQQELGGFSESGWAGVYNSEDGLTAGTQLSWTPVAGFVVRWSTCAHGWREKVNYGHALFQNGSLKLAPELIGNSGNVYPLAIDYIPVLWGEQHYLIPADQLINFCYAAKNAGNSPEINAFFIKKVDNEKQRKGLPNVPPEYRKYLHSRPLTTAISAVKPKSKPWIQRFTLDVGRAEGAVSGMKFYTLYPKNIYMLLEVTEVGEHTSEAYVITSGFKNNSEKEVKPQVGWKLTSRAPKDAWSHYPG